MVQKMLSIGAKAFPLESLQTGLFSSKETEKAAIWPKSGHFRDGEGVLQFGENNLSRIYYISYYITFTYEIFSLSF